MVNHAYAATGAGLYRCAETECRKDFTVTTGTVMERSQIALHKWLMAFTFMNASKKGVSSHQLHRMLGVTYQSAWFMSHRIREAMRDTATLSAWRRRHDRRSRRNLFRHAREDKEPPEAPQDALHKEAAGRKNKRPIVALVERGGNVRTFHVPVADKVTVTKIVRENIAKESRLHTDESRLYKGSEDHFDAHKTVKHSAEEYVRRDIVCARGNVNTNTDWKATSQSSSAACAACISTAARSTCTAILAEFDFRFNHRVALGLNDVDRTIAAVKGATGKRPHIPATS